MEIANVVVRAVNAAQAAELLLRAGTDVVVRVHEAPPDGGRGVVSLAGVLLQARLPAGLQAGQPLPVRIVEATAEQLVLRVRDDGTAPPVSGHAAHAAGALAVSGHPDLLRAALTLAPPELALPLPNGDALTLTVGDEDGAEAEEGGGGDGEAAFVLHSAALGPIAVRVRLAAGSVSATVSVEPEALAAVQAAAPALASALERATARPAQVGVGARAAQQRPPAPVVAEGLDAYA